MKKTTLLATAVLATTILGTGITASAAAVEGVTSPVLDVEVKASTATFAFDKTELSGLIDFKDIDFDAPSLSGAVAVDATLSNKDFGEKQVDVSVATNGTGLKMDSKSTFSVKVPQATKKSESNTFAYTLDATKFKSEEAKSYNVTITAQEKPETPEIPEG